MLQVFSFQYSIDMHFYEVTSYFLLFIFTPLVILSRMIIFLT